MENSDGTKFKIWIRNKLFTRYVISPWPNFTHFLPNFHSEVADKPPAYEDLKFHSPPPKYESIVHSTVTPNDVSDTKYDISFLWKLTILCNNDFLFLPLKLLHFKIVRLTVASSFLRVIVASFLGIWVPTSKYLNSWWLSVRNKDRRWIYFNMVISGPLPEKISGEKFIAGNFYCTKSCVF